MYKQGDILVNKDGDKRMVLAVCGSVVAISLKNSFDSFGEWADVSRIEYTGYTVEQPKWEPKNGEQYWRINEVGDVRSAMWEEDHWYDRACRKFLGAYRTEQEAQEAADRIKELLKK